VNVHRTSATSAARAAGRLARAAVDLVYPPHCLACRADIALEDDPFLCPRCRDRMQPVSDPCPRCGTPRGPFAPPDDRCDSCRGRPLHFDASLGVFLYEGPVKRLLHRLKFEGLEAASRPLAERALDIVAGHPLLEGLDASVPVPVHWRRRLQRGYNQSERLSRRLAAGLRLDHLEALRKTGRREPQVNLPREKRLRNPHGAFAPTHRAGIRGRAILLVDDVMTSAATASECARVLKDAGAKRVVALAVARQTLG